MNARAKIAPPPPPSRAQAATLDERGAGHRHTRRIGPNAITRMAEAVAAIESAATVRRIFTTAGLAHHLDSPPTGMVDEREVTALHRVARAELGLDRAATVSWIAGRLTGDYLLANRIPMPAQRLLRVMPPPIAARLLCAAISRHAWTFAGSGTFTVTPGHPMLLSIAGCPICRGTNADAALCGYYAATFERLFAVLVSPATRVQEAACSAQGAPTCTFELRWR